MNICFDSKGIIAAKNRGIGNYTINIVKSILKNYPDNHYYLISWTDECLKEKYFTNDLIKEINCKIGWDISWDYKAVKSCILENLKKYNIDVYIDTAPVISGYPNYDKLWFENTLLVGVVYDFIPLVFAENMIEDIDGGVRYIQKIVNLKGYDLLISISETTKLDTIKFLNVSSEDIVNCYMDGNQFDSELSDSAVSDVRKKFKITNKYYISTVWLEYHKNLERILDAYGMAYIENKDIPDLVMTGKIQPKYNDLIENKLSSYNLKDKIHFVGYVSDDDLHALYYGADWLIFPSMYEGFGMPVLEAWRHNIPVITSNNSSLGEIAKGSAILTNPFDTTSIKEAILESASMNDEERANLINLGINRAKEFSWDKTTREYMNQITKVNKVIDLENYLNKLKDMRRVEKILTEELISRLNINKFQLLKAKNLIIFGAGNYGKKLYDVMPGSLVPYIKCFCDNVVRGKLNGLEIISLDEAINKYDNAVYIVASKYAVEDITKQLLKANIPCDCIMNCNEFGDF